MAEAEEGAEGEEDEEGAKGETEEGASDSKADLFKDDPHSTEEGASDSKADVFKDDPHSPFAVASEEQAALLVTKLSEENDKGHKMEVGKNTESAIGEVIVKERDSAPREQTAIVTLLVSLAKEIKVFTKLTQYGARLLTAAMMCENICENVSDVVNVFDLYNRGELVYFGFSLGTIVSFGSVLSLRVSSCVRAVVLMGRWICFIFLFLSSLSFPLLSHYSAPSLLSIYLGLLSPHAPPLCLKPQPQLDAQLLEALGTSFFVCSTGQDPWDCIYACTTTLPFVSVHRYITDKAAPKESKMNTENIM